MSGGSGSPPNSTVNYLSPAITLGNWNTVEADRQTLIPHDMTLDNLHVFVKQAPGSGKSYTFTIFKNGSATALSAVLSDTNTTASDTTHSVSFTAGDTISLCSTPSGTPTIPIALTWCMDQTATGKFAFLGQDSSAYITTGFQGIHGAGSAADTVGEVDGIMPIAGTFSNAYLKLYTAPGAGTSLTYTLYVNGADTDISVTIADTNTSGSDTTHSASVSAGDSVAWHITSSGAISGTILDSTAISFAPSTDGQSCMLFGKKLAMSTSSTQYNFPQGDSSGNTTESNRPFIFNAITLLGLYVDLSAAPGSGKSYAITINNGGSATALTKTIADTSTSGNIASNVSISEGDIITMVNTPSGTPDSAMLSGGLAMTDGTVTATFKPKLIMT